MNSNEIDFANLSSKMRYYNNGKKKEIVSPSAYDLFKVLNLLQSNPEKIGYTVDLFRYDSSLLESAGEYCLEIQGEESKFIVTLSKGNDRFASPNFDVILGGRGIIEVIGNEWASSRICTNFSIVLDIAKEFCLRGKLAYPEVWRISS